MSILTDGYNSKYFISLSERLQSIIATKKLDVTDIVAAANLERGKSTGF